MDVKLNVDFNNQLSRIRLDPYCGGIVHSPQRHVERSKKQAMPVKMSLPVDVEVDAEPVSPGKDSPQKGDMHSHLWGSAKSKPKPPVKPKPKPVKSKPEQTVSMHLHGGEEMRGICKDESHLLGKAPDSQPDSIDSLGDSIQKKLELLDQPNDNYTVPSGWSTEDSIGTAQKDAIKSLPVDKPEGDDAYCLSDSILQETDSIETVNELDSKIHKKIKDLDEPCNFRAPPGWESRDSMESVPSARRGQPVQESGEGASRNVMPSESYSKHQPHHANTSFSYAVGPSDMEVELRPEDYLDMPLRLRVPNADIFLITSDQDKWCGKHLKDLMEEVQFQLNEDETTMCKVYLWDDMDHKSSIIDCITEAQEMCTYVFILLTRNFCNDKFADFQKDDTLVRSVTTQTRRWGIVPLYTQPKRDAPEDKAYKIPNGLISFKGLDMSRLMKDKENVEALLHLHDGDVYFRRGLVSMLEARVHERIAREAQRMKDRHEWIEERKKERRWEILMEQNQKRLEMDRDNRQIQQQLASLPKQLPLSPPTPVVFKQEEPKRATTQESAPCDSRYGAPPPGPSPAHIPAPGQTMFYPQYVPMMFSPEQMMQQQYNAMLYMQQNMQFPGQHQPPMQPPLQPQFPFFMQQHYPVPNPYQTQPYLPPQPAVPTAQPQQPVDTTSPQGTPVHNYYINAGGNVQVGSQATMVTQEPAATAGYEDDADALERKYNPDKQMEEESKCPGSSEVRIDHHQDWYAEPKKPPDEKPPKEPQHLRLPKPSDMWTKGRRSPVEGESPLLPEKLPERNLVQDDPSSSSCGKFYSNASFSQTSQPSSEFTPLARPYEKKHPTPSENAEPVNSVTSEMGKYFGVEVRALQTPTENQYDSYEEQTVPKKYTNVIGNPSIPMSPYDPMEPQTPEEYPKKI